MTHGIIPESTLPCNDLPTSSQTRACPHAWKLAEDLRKAIETASEAIPEGQDGEPMAQVAAGWPEVDDPSEAWEMLDPLLNRLLGYGKTAEQLAKEVRRGPKGLDGILSLIQHFVTTFDTITGRLLEGKISKLLEAIQIA